MSTTSIIYKTDLLPDTAAIIALYECSGINRPIDDTSRIAAMYQNSNLVISAWQGDLLVGIARSLTDFCYCCYLSDLAVHIDLQKQGVGEKLIELTKKKIGHKASLILLSAPNAMDYYPKKGFDKISNGFIIKRKA